MIFEVEDSCYNSDIINSTCDGCVTFGDKLDVSISKNPSRD